MHCITDYFSDPLHHRLNIENCTNVQLFLLYLCISRFQALPFYLGTYSLQLNYSYPYQVLSICLVRLKMICPNLCFLRM